MSKEIEYVNLDDPATALSVSQRSKAILSKSSLAQKSIPTSLVSSLESPDGWAELEQVFHACLRSGDDEAAFLCLERLTGRFGATNHRIMALRGLYQEAVAKDEVELRAILQSYNEMLRQDPMNVPIHKRRTALICSVGRYVDAIDCLVSYLNSFPGDAESWCELADLYQDQGMISQAIYCMEEAILLQPNAWNLHARLGELNYVASQSSSDGVSSTIKHLSEAVHRLSRSIELCQNYLRGYYGLKLATDKLLQLDLSKVNEVQIGSTTTRRLNELATSRLRSIVASYPSPTHTRKAEVIAAQAVLNNSKI